MCKVYCSFIRFRHHHVGNVLKYVLIKKTLFSTIRSLILLCYNFISVNGMYLQLGSIYLGVRFLSCYLIYTALTMCSSLHDFFVLPSNSRVMIGMSWRWSLFSYMWYFCFLSLYIWTVILQLVNFNIVLLFLSAAYTFCRWQTSTEWCT